MQTRRKDLRAAAIWTAASYIPFILAANCAGGVVVDEMMRAVGLRGGHWTMALIASLTLGYFLAIDAALPVGRSKIDLVRGAIRRMGATLTSNEAWGARVAIGIGCTIVVQVACDLL